HGDSSFIRQFAICSRTEALFSQLAISSRRFQFHQPICDLFTNGSVVQPIRYFITKILVSSANLRFVHEHRRCSANSQFHHEDSSLISQLAICSPTEALFIQ